MRQVKIGVIGTGTMGRNHVRLLSEEKSCFDLVGIYDASDTRAQTIAEQFSTKAYASVSSLLAEVEAVVIAVPSSLHGDVAQKVADSGVHALIEKPLAMTVPEAALITKQFAAKNLKLAVGHVERFNPVVCELKKLLIHEKVIAIELRRYSPYDGRISDANVVQDLMIHDIDLACYLLGQYTGQRIASVGSVVKSERLDFVHSTLEFDPNIKVMISASRVTQNKVREIVVHTENSYIEGDLLSKTLRVTQNTNMVIDKGEECAYKQDSVTQKIFVPIVEPLRAELQEFYKALREQSPVAVDGETATKTLALCEQIMGQISL